MVKKCTCLPKAGKIATEIEQIARNVRPDTIVEDADYISGMLFVVQESGLANTLDEFNEILDASKGRDYESFMRAAAKASRKIDYIECSL